MKVVYLYERLAQLTRELHAEKVLKKQEIKETSARIKVLEEEIFDLTLKLEEQECQE